MNTIIDKEKCTGCTACMNICLKSAINIETDEMGFEYPTIDREKCIECGLCKKVCPVLNKNNIKEFNKICYAAYNKNLNSRLSSSSGGIFELLARYIIDNNGIVVGATIDNEFNIYHKIITRETEIEDLKRSKYAQSSMGNIYKEIKTLLNNNILVLFTGTQCQIAGLKSFLNKEYNNLYCVSIICHGVPSNEVLKDYIKYQENKFNVKINYINFRKKDDGWKQFKMELISKDKVIYCEKFSFDKFMNIFLSNISLRESCYNCNFKGKNDNSDITLGDFWGIEKINKNMDDDKGTSAIIINNEKANQLFNMIREDLIYEKSNYNDIALYNSALVKSATKPKKYLKFKRDYLNYGFDYVVSHNYKSRSVKSMISKLIPDNLKKFIKKLIHK